MFRYNEFIAEARKDKNLLIELLAKLLKEKPEVKMESKTFPDEKGAYSIAGIKKYFKNNGGYSSADADDALHSIENAAPYKSKYKVDHIMVRNHHYDENYPYMYMGLTAEEAKKIKESLEKLSMDSSMPIKSKREAAKKAAIEVKKVPSEADKKEKIDRKTPKRPRAKRVRK